MGAVTAENLRGGGGENECREGRGWERGGGGGVGAAFIGGV